VSREKIRLGEEPAGKGYRYRRMVKGKTWISKVYPALTRRNRAEAWNDFVEWRKQHLATQNPKPISVLKPDGSVDFDLLEKTGLKGEEKTLLMLRQIGEHTLRARADFLGFAGDTQGQLEAKALAEDFLQTPINKIFDRLQEVFCVPLWATVEQSLPRISRKKDKSLTARVLADEFVASYESKAKTGNGSWGRHGQVVSGLNVFCQWYGEQKGMDHFSTDHWREFSAYLKKKVADGEYAAATALDHQKTVRTFLARLAGDYPELSGCMTRNLQAEHLRIPVSRKEPTVFTKDEIGILLKNANDRMRLFLLLMLNCGMYQGDIADLKASEIDWEHGRIVRPRSKTRKANEKKGDPFRYNWMLWPTTLALLKAHAQKTGLALLTTEGKPLINHKASTRNDAVRSAFSRLIKKLKNRKLLPAEWNKPLKSLRKTGANIIAQSSDPTIAGFYEPYLNQNTVAHRNYLQSGQPHAGFDRAIEFIGIELGQIGATTVPATPPQPPAPSRRAGNR
jgi:integrase